MATVNELKIIIFVLTYLTVLVAGEQALLFARAKQTSRERASEASLARTRERGDEATRILKGMKLRKIKIEKVPGLIIEKLPLAAVDWRSNSHLHEHIVSCL